MYNGLLDNFDQYYELPDTKRKKRSLNMILLV